MKRKTIRRFFRRLASFIKKTVVFLFYASVIFLAFHWFPWNRFATPVDTAEVDKYYALLKEHQRPVDVLTLSLGINDDEDLRAEVEKAGMQSKDELPIALNRLIKAMELEATPISLEYGDQEKPPAFVTNFNQERMVITVSRLVKLRREQMSLLVHELGHIAVWGMDRSAPMICGQETASAGSLLSGCHQERVVDCSGFFQGQGILTLNGLTDETFSTADRGTRTEKKVFGYLKPEQYGYLLARYCADHGIPARNIEFFLEPAGRKYFNIGNEYLKRSAVVSVKPAAPATGVYWCPKCGQHSTVDLSGELAEIRCPKCSFHIKIQNAWERTTRFIYVRLVMPMIKLFHLIKLRMIGIKSPTF